jgi:hypothetical protein
MTEVKSFFEAMELCEKLNRWYDLKMDIEYLYCKFMSMNDPHKEWQEYLWQAEAKVFKKSNASKKLELVRSAKTEEEYKVALVKCKLLDEFKPETKVPYYK